MQVFFYSSCDYNPGCTHSLICMDCNSGHTIACTRMVSIQSEGQCFSTGLDGIVMMIYCVLIEISEYPSSPTTLVSTNSGDYLEFHCSILGAQFMPFDLVFQVVHVMGLCAAQWRDTAYVSIH